MNGGLKGLLTAAVLAAVGVGLYKLQVHGQPLPAIVPRTGDAHREVSSALDARIGRFLDDRRAPANSAVKLVALTFDDGPYPVETPLLLDVLADLHVRATFFLVGDSAELFPRLAERIARDGHELANHTLTHPAHFESLDAAGVAAELDGAARVLERFSDDPGIRTLMRPPHGRYTEYTVRAAQRAGYHFILWNDDPGDWRATTGSRLARHVETYASAPDIILLHSGKIATIDMLPEVVGRFRKAGFQFVTVSDLMARVSLGVIEHPAKTPL